MPSTTSTSINFLVLCEFILRLMQPSPVDVCQGMRWVSEHINMCVKERVRPLKKSIIASDAETRGSRGTENTCMAKRSLRSQQTAGKTGMKQRHTSFPCFTLT